MEIVTQEGKNKLLKAMKARDREKAEEIEQLRQEHARMLEAMKREAEMRLQHEEDRTREVLAKVDTYRLWAEGEADKARQEAHEKVLEAEKRCISLVKVSSI